MEGGASICLLRFLTAIQEFFLSRLPGNGFCILMKKNVATADNRHRACMRGWASRMGLVLGPGPGPGQAKPTSCLFVESTRTEPSLAQRASVGVVDWGAGGASPGMQGAPSLASAPSHLLPHTCSWCLPPVNHSRCHLSLGDDFTLITLIKRH